MLSTTNSEPAVTDTLFPYQQDGAEFLASRPLALLADEMGLGKTAQAIRGCDLVHATRILIVCPAVACTNWVREFEEFSITPREFTVIDRQLFDISVLSDETRNFIVSYDLARWVAPLLAGRFSVLILDEAHFLKSLETKRTKAVLGRGGLVRLAARTWALSGTPAPNHYGELYPLLHTFGVYRGDFESFVKEFCRTAPGMGRNPFEGPRIVGSNERNAPKLRAMLAQTMLRRRKDDVMKQLPAVSYEKLLLKPGPVDLQMQQTFAPYFYPDNRVHELLEKLTMEREAVEAVLKADREANWRVKGEVTASGLEALTAMAKSVSTLRRYTGMQKVDPVARLIIDELERGEYEKIVVFAVHVEVIYGLRDRLGAAPLYRPQGFTKDYNPVTLYGGTPLEKRQKNVDKFQRDGRTKVFIGNIAAAGTAITLTRAHQVLFIEQSWVPGDNAQAAMRVHRIGQTKPVTVRFATIENSIDEKISNALRRKAAELQKIFDVERENEFTKQKAVSKTDTQYFETFRGRASNSLAAGEVGGNNVQHFHSGDDDRGSQSED